MKNQRKAGFFLSYISIFVSSVVGILFTPYMITTLGKSEYGLYQLLHATIGYFALLDFGLGSTLTRFIIKYKTSNEPEKVDSVVTMCMKIYFLMGTITLAITLLGAISLKSLFPGVIDSANFSEARAVLIIMGVTTALSFLRHALSGIQSAEEQYAVTKIIVIVQHVLRVLFILVLINSGMGALGVAIADLIVVNLLLLFDIYYCKAKLHYYLMKGSWDSELFKTLFTFSVFVFMQIIVNRINISLDSVILGRFGTLEMVALYGVAMQLYSLFNSFGGVISHITLPQLSKVVFSGGSLKEVTDCCARYSRIQLHVSAPLLGGFIVLGRHFISLWTPAYNAFDVYIVVLLITVPQVLELVEGTIFNVMKAKNLQGTRSVILVCVAVLHVFLSVFLVKIYPTFGTAMGTCISFVIGNTILSNIYYHKKVGVDIFSYFKQLFSGIIVALILSIGIGFLINMLPIDGWLGFIVKGCLYVGEYGILIWIFGVNEKERAYVSGVVGKIVRKTMRKINKNHC